MNVSDRLSNGSIERVVKYVNKVSNTRHKVSSTDNQNAISDMLDICNDNVSLLIKFIVDNTQYIIDNATHFGNHIIPLRKLFFEKYNKEENGVSTAMPIDSPSQVDITSMLSQIALTALKSVDNSFITNEILNLTKNELDTYVKNTYGVLPHKVEVITPKAEIEFDGVVHEKFDLIYNLVESNTNVYLTGPAGTGKSELCRQIAKAMNLNFYMSNAVTQEFKLTGYSDANGVYHPTSFYKAFAEGGLFLLDEMDASTPEVLTLLNGALANGYFDFPAPIGMVYAHKDFRCIAAGNTYGEGATYEYNARNQLDASCLDRFIVIEVDYDENIEKACANNDRDLVCFVHKLRKGAQKAGVKLIVSYRAIKSMTKLSPLFSDKAELLKSCIIKSLTIDDMNNLQSYVRDCGDYTKAYDSLLSGMKSKA